MFGDSLYRVRGSTVCMPVCSMAPAQIGHHRHHDSEYQGTVLEKGISEKEFLEWDNPSESTIVHHRKGESVRSGSFNLTCFGTCARIAPLSCFQVGYLPAQPRSAWPARIPGRCSKESIVQLNLKPPRVRQQHRALCERTLAQACPRAKVGISQFELELYIYI